MSLVYSGKGGGAVIMSLDLGNQLCLLRLGAINSLYCCSLVCFIVSHILSDFLWVDKLKGLMLCIS